MYSLRVYRKYCDNAAPRSVVSTEKLLYYRYYYAYHILETAAIKKCSSRRRNNTFSIQYNNGTIVLHNLCNNYNMCTYNCTSKKVCEVAFARSRHYYNSQTKK